MLRPNSKKSTKHIRFSPTPKRKPLTTSLVTLRPVDFPEEAVDRALVASKVLSNIIIQPLVGEIPLAIWVIPLRSLNNFSVDQILLAAEVRPNPTIPLGFLSSSPSPVVPRR